MARFSFYDVTVTILSFMTYVADLSTDIWLIVYFFSQGYQIWGALTLAFVALATLVMEIFSFHWHVTDRTVTPKIFIIHILFLAPFHRYIQVIRHGLKSRETGKQEDIDRAFREVNDVCILRLFETFLEAAPQVVLQLYIILSDFKSVGYVVGVSMLFSLLSLSWAVTAYTDALHLAYKKLYKRTGLSLCAHLVWQTGMITARVLAIVLFAVAFNAFVAIPLVAHVIIMTLWILLIKPEFGSTPCERNLFVGISSLIHIFCFLNLKDSQSRWRMFFFYSVTLVENTVFVTLWYFFQPSSSPEWLDILAFTVVFGGFALGCAGMVTYYGCCHPSGPSPIPALKPAFHIAPPQQLQPKPQNKRQYLELPQKSTFPKLDESSRSARINLWLHASLDLSKEGLVENPIDHLDTPGADQNWNGSHDRSPRSVPYRQPPEGHESEVQNNGRPLFDSCVHVLSPNATYLANRSRSYLQTSEDRLDYTLDRQTAQYPYGEPTMSDKSLVEMFSRCKLDPSFVSTGSLNDSGVCQSKTDESAYNSRQGDSSGTSGYRTSLSTTSPSYPSAGYTTYDKAGIAGAIPHIVGSGNSLNSQNDYVNYTTIDNSISEIHPAQISPLDANKLWQEYSESIAYPSGSDLTLSKNISADVSLTPDYLRGIGRLSLSYSCLSEPENKSNPQQYHSLTETASSFFYSKRPHGSQGSMGSSLNHSQGVSFSNLSLQLPDSSYNRQKPKRHNKTLSPNNGGSYGDIQNQANNLGRSRLPYDNKTDTKDNSLTDKQSSFYSDRCLSSSDQGLSSLGSVVERSHRSLTSSGFQSEESNTTELSPPYPAASQKNYQNMYHQSTPILENEISAIYSLPSTIRAAKRESMDSEVYLPGRASLYRTPHSGTGGRADSKMAPTSALFGPTGRTESPEPLSLPPLTVRSRSSSSDRSSRSGGKFFKDPLAEESKSQSDLSDEGSCPSSLCSNKSENSIPMEKSYISAMISNLSSSRLSANSSGSISLNSSLTPPLNNQKDSKLKELYNSLPTSANIEPPLYQNIVDYSPNNNISHSFSDSNSSRSRDSSRLDYLTKDPSEQSKIMELLAEMSSMSGGGKPDCQDYMNVDGPSPQLESEMEDFPHCSIDNFDRDRWRASLDKQERDKIIQDIENMAPKKLYQLRTKLGEPKKKMSPMKISNYTDSPYKFRKPGSNGSNDINSSSPSSLGSAYEGMKAVTPALYTDYVNVYDISNARTGTCPIATPESLSDTVILDEPSDICGRTFNVRGEIDNSSHRSLELSRTKSPINTSGYNSAFKPVKPRSTSSSNSSDIDARSNMSGSSGNRSSSSSDRSVMSDCGDFKKPRPVYPANNSGSVMEDSSSFRWSKGSSQDSTAEPSDYSSYNMNYLELVGKDPLSFSMSKYPAEENASVSSKHSYTDSIPWEDSINKSANFTGQAEPSALKSTGRPPLKSLENTPVFSPIYGGQSAKVDELSCRKRFMSTPKVSGNSVLSVSDTQGADFQSSSHSNTPRRDSYMRNKTFNNTSTWSSQSDQQDDSSRNFLNESHFSSLSRTTYI